MSDNGGEGVTEESSHDSSAVGGDDNSDSPDDTDDDTVASNRQGEGPGDNGEETKDEEVSPYDDDDDVQDESGKHDDDKKDDDNGIGGKEALDNSDEPGGTVSDGVGGDESLELKPKNKVHFAFDREEKKSGSEAGTRGKEEADNDGDKTTEVPPSEKTEEKKVEADAEEDVYETIKKADDLVVMFCKLASPLPDSELACKSENKAFINATNAYRTRVFFKKKVFQN